MNKCPWCEKQDSLVNLQTIDGEVEIVCRKCRYEYEDWARQQGWNEGVIEW